MREARFCADLGEFWPVWKGALRSGWPLFPGFVRFALCLNGWPETSLARAINPVRLKCCSEICENYWARNDGVRGNGRPKVEIRRSVYEIGSWRAGEPNLKSTTL